MVEAVSAGGPLDRLCDFTPTVGRIDILAV
jgi:hypothetical protein